jgi:hypothetical protein
MSNEAVTVNDLVWRRPEDYTDQTSTLTALTTIHYHFCPFTCHGGHDEEHVLLLYLWDYRDWFRRQYRPPFTTTARMSQFRSNYASSISFLLILPFLSSRFPLDLYDIGRRSHHMTPETTRDLIVS